MPAVTSREHVQLAARARKHLATYEKARDLVNIGAYVSGSDTEIDESLRVLPALNSFLQQDTKDVTPFENTLSLLEQSQA
jgi:flagellar biosynthesis/type III secretory pathway ATPase